MRIAFGRHLPFFLATGTGLDRIQESTHMPIRFMPQHGSKDKLLCLFDASSRIGVLSNEIAGHLGDCFSAIKPPENEVLR